MFSGISPAEEESMYEEIDRMLGLGPIEESESACFSPIVKNEILGPLVDYLRRTRFHVSTYKMQLNVISFELSNATSSMSRLMTKWSSRILETKYSSTLMSS